MKEKQKIKVLWLPSWFPHRGYTLYGNFIEKQAKAVAHYCEVAVLFLTAEKGLKKEEVVVSEADFLRILVYYPASNNVFLKVFFFLRATRKGLKTLEKRDFTPDMTHLHIITLSSIVALYFRLVKKCPFVITEHWSEFNNRKPKNMAWFRRLSFRFVSYFSSKILAISDYFLASLRLHGIKGDSTVIPNIVDVEVFCPPRVKTQNDVFQLLHISHLHDQHKNISGILRGIKSLSEKRQDFHLTIVGPLERHEQHELLANELIISHLVSFKDVMTYDKVADQMQKAMFLFYSVTEKAYLLCCWRHFLLAYPLWFQKQAA
ncbi:MAG: glycosyltransferase family 4 protein [Saprospiraceae bacterium]|nr:glycosyltransferase family 4 protein [Saprospiraceae bacterium]